MPDSLETAIARINAVSSDLCESQMYAWPGFNPMNPDPDRFFAQEGIEFDGLLFIRYPVKRTFNPIPRAQLEDEERVVGATLPSDYRLLLEEFGTFHLPGKAKVAIESPAEALRTTRACWCYEGKQLSVLAISAYNATSDGNAIGFVRQGDSFGMALYEFDHERLYQGDDPSLWTTKISDSLADFVVEYLRSDV
jgi:hypothetical protein